MKCELSRCLSSKLNENELTQYGLEYLAKDESYAGYFFDRFTIPVLLDLQNAADKEDIPLLFFKGAIEKYDTYKPLHLNRDQRDVDILVSYDDVFRLCQICKDLGFAPEGEKLMRTGLNPVCPIRTGIICP